MADAVSTFEEFVAAEAEAGRFALPFRPEAGRVLLHGHCHQKALVGTGFSHRVLELAGYTVEEVRHGRLVRLRGGAPGGVAGDGRTPPTTAMTTATADLIRCGA